jgi:hypothetical protein
VAAAIYYVPLASAIGGFSELRERAAFQNVKHPEPFPYYFWQLPLGLLPAGLLLPAMIAGLRRPDPVARTCALAVGIGVVIFSMSPSKQSHYLLPLYPLAAQWAARAVSVGSWTPARRMAAAAVVFLAVACMVTSDVIRARHGGFPTPAAIMRDFAWMSRGKPLAMLERHPMLAYHVDRPDVAFPADAEAATRFAEERWGFVIVDLEKGETLAPGLARLAILNQQEADGHRYLLLTHRMHRITGVESASPPTAPPENR